MKLLVAFSLSALWLAAAEGPSKAAASKAGQSRAAQSKPAPSKPATPKTAPAPQAMEIPKDAVEFETGTFRQVDAQGKKWLYRRTPFGVSRWEEGPEDLGVKAGDEYLDVKAVEDGDAIRFERPSPFGIQRWTAKKTQLNAMERTVWNREQANTASGKD